MATKSNIASAAAAFAAKWKGQGYEKGQTQPFWLELLQKVLGVTDPYSLIEFEGQVKNLNTTSFMDAYIASTKVLIEQKSIEKDLGKPVPQSDGTMLTPYQQARKYVVDMPVSKHPRWIVICNFREFRIYDMEKPLGEPEVMLLKDLERDYYRLQFLVDDSKELHRKEVEVSMAAGRIIGEIYDALLKEYRNPDDEATLRSLNVLCVRLVFCLYAEDAGLFDTHSQFHDYLVQFKPGTGDMRRALIDLFDTLNTPEDKRDPYLRDDLRAFPYVNGGLFARKDIEIPRFNDTIARLLLKHASDDFDWSTISPTIFGGVFESTLNPETRRAGGMHYTSIENIHKVIDPLFLAELREELSDIKAEPQEKRRIARAKEFQDKIAGLKFLDPACGSGNFLTETFLSLRRMENDCIRIIYKGNMLLGEFVNPVKVSIDQFYGIEINDFAVSVAMTALWIAEAQMLFETEKIMQTSLDFLPLKSYTNIHEGNALRMDWNEVVPAIELNYIMGNPPFVAKTGRSSAQDSHSKAIMDEDQKEDKVKLLGPNSGVLDYVCCWFKKAALYIQNTTIKVAFVATDSICQGQQVAPLWKSLLADGIKINFAYQFFRWDSEAGNSATVYVIIVGMSIIDSTTRLIFDSDGKHIVEHINPYLIDAPDVLIESRSKPLMDVPTMGMGNQPIDNGQYLFTPEERADFIKHEPQSEAYFHPWLDAYGFINGKEKYCLWLGDCSPRIIKEMPECYKRVIAVRDFRLSSNRASTKKLADKPTRFQTENMPKGNYIAIPEVSSGNRRYIPIGFLDDSVLCSNKLRLMPEASLYHFGILTSSLHMAWMRTVGGYFGPSYQYSVNIVYNNFPWPMHDQNSSLSAKDKVEKTAQEILNARALFPDSSLADLYDPDLMPFELRKAHRTNDAAVLEAYGFPKDATESDIVARLFKMYKELTSC